MSQKETFTIDVHEAVKNAIQDMMEGYNLSDLIYDIAVQNPEFWAKTFAPAINESIKRAIEHKGYEVLKEIIGNLVEQSDFDYLIRGEIKSVASSIIEEKVKRVLKLEDNNGN